MKKVIKRREVPEVNLKGLSDMHPVVARVLAARGCSSSSEMDYQLKNILPITLKGLDKACELLVDAIYNDRRILIVGDFDVDGATSTSLMVKCLRQLGSKHVDFIVPNRFEYGYGLTPEIVYLCKERNPDIIVTVDNGIASIDGVKTAKDLGIKVLITDHHLPGETLPEADAIVNPNQPGCPFEAKSLAGVGVAFYVMLALRRALRDSGFFNEQNPEPDLAEHLDLVTLGTVADVVPLEYNNRILVDRGVARIRAGKVSPGIRALLIIGNRDITKLKASDLGFAVAPRLNAAGRLDDMTIGIRCLLSTDFDEAMTLAKRLDVLNTERRSIEADMQEEANDILDQLFISLEGKLPNTLCLYQQDWHQGVIGILASRIKDRAYRPVIVFARDKDGVLKGSGRSIPGIHLRDVLANIAAKNEGLLKKFGGHAMAAGLSLEEDKLPLFKEVFEKEVEQSLNGDDIEASIETDGELSPELFTVEFCDELNRFGPWGQSFPEPQFYGRFFVREQVIIAQKHLKMFLSPTSLPELALEAIAFNVDLKEWPKAFCDEIVVVYKLSINEFRGSRKLQLMLEYLEPAG